MTLVPGIVDDSIIFTEKLASHAAKGEVFRLEEDATRLTVDIIGKVTLDLHLIERPTPLAFPLLVERMRESMSSEKLSERIARMVKDLEKVADNGKR